MRLIFFVFITFLIQNLFGQIDTNFTKDIPYYKSGRPTPYFYAIREKEKYLNLDTIENGYDSLQIRIWYNYPKSGVGYQILSLKRQNSIWTATLYTRARGYTSSKGTNLQVNPISDWNIFMKKLYSYNIMSLPDLYKIKGYRGFAIDGWSYYIEISDKHHYRLYSYHHPESFYKQRFKDVRKMMKILKLIRKEFGIKLINESY
jgi:hypothetical protein